MAATLTPSTDPVAVMSSVHGLLDQMPAVIAAASAAEVLRLVGRAQARLDAVKTAAARARAADAPAADLTTWLGSVENTDPAKASAVAGLATTMTADSVTEQGLRRGDFSSDHARINTSALASLPADVTASERERVERSLASRARFVPPARLRRDARRALEHAGRTREQVDAHADQVLRSEEDRAWQKASVFFRDNTDGTTFCGATIPSMHAGLLKKILQTMTAPRRTSSNADADGTSAAGIGAGQTDWGHAWGVAFCQLLEHLPTDHLTGKTAATLVVNIDLDTLRDGLRAATLDTGLDLSASEARRLACKAGLIPAVLAGDSLPLDLGRQERLFTHVHRVALSRRYETCAEENCDRPYAWTELHHRHLWSTGGETNLDLAIPLCAHHHRLAHQPDTAVTYLRDGPTWTVRIERRT